MPQPLPPNPWSSHSYSQPRNMNVCAHPNCQLAISESRMLCELHGAPHRPRQVDDPGDETP